MIAPVSATDSALAYWAFHIPNMILAALIYTLIGRYILSLFFGIDSDKVVMRVFRSITDPVIDAVAAITPKIVPRGLILIFAIVWLLALRMILFITFAIAGLRPGLGG